MSQLHFFICSSWSILLVLSSLAYCYYHLLSTLAGVECCLNVSQIPATLLVKIYRTSHLCFPYTQSKIQNYITFILASHILPDTRASTRLKSQVRICTSNPH